MNTNYDKIRFIPLEELETPKTGYQAMVGYFWVIKDGCAMAYCRFGNKENTGSPQCNMNETIAKRLKEKLYPDAEVVQVPVAFWPLDLE